MKIIVTGGEGQLAIAISKVETNHIIQFPSRSKLDIINSSSISLYCRKAKPDAIIHAAAMTRPMSEHFCDPARSINTNIIGTCNIANYCYLNGIKLIYISTDYVYPGTEGGYKENSAVGPYTPNLGDGISNYGWSKLGGECAVRLVPNSLIIRACICQKPFPHKTAFKDVIKSMMYIEDAAPTILRLINKQGVVNLGGISQSVYDFAAKENESVTPMLRKDIKSINYAPNNGMDTTLLAKYMNEGEG